MMQVFGKLDARVEAGRLSLKDRSTLVASDGRATRAVLQHRLRCKNASTTVMNPRYIAKTSPACLFIASLRGYIRIECAPFRLAGAVAGRLPVARPAGPDGFGV